MSWYQLGARPSATILEWDFTATWSTLSSIHITLQLLNKPQSREVSYTLVSVILAGSCSHGDKASCSLTMNMVAYVYCWSMLHSYGGPMCGDEGTPRGCMYDLSADLHWQTPHLIKPLMYIKKNMSILYSVYMNCICICRYYATDLCTVWCHGQFSIKYKNPLLASKSELL